MSFSDTQFLYDQVSSLSNALKRCLDLDNEMQVVKERLRESTVSNERLRSALEASKQDARQVQALAEQVPLLENQLSQMKQQNDEVVRNYRQYIDSLEKELQERNMKRITDMYKMHDDFELVKTKNSQLQSQMEEMNQALQTEIRRMQSAESRNQLTEERNRELERTIRQLEATIEDMSRP